MGTIAWLIRSFRFELSRQSTSCSQAASKSRPSGLSIGFLTVTMLLGTGCRTGGVPSFSWWPGNSENSQLAKDGGEGDGVRKPSETYPPYPQTSTPNAYGLGDVVPASAESAVGTTAGDSAPVTYGKTAPTQVGPYQSYPSTGLPQGNPPAGTANQSPLVGSSAVPDSDRGGATYAGGWSKPPAGQAANPEDMAVAEAVSQTQSEPRSQFSKGVSPPGASAPDVIAADPTQTGPTPMAVVGGDPRDRYASAAGSRFSSDGAPVAPFAGQPPLETAPVVQPAGVPAVTIQSPAAIQPELSVPDAHRPVTGGQSTSPPVNKRPETLYRPGGTSTYRPAQAILQPNQTGAGLAWGDKTNEASVGPAAPANPTVVPAGFSGGLTNP